METTTSVMIEGCSEGSLGMGGLGRLGLGGAGFAGAGLRLFMLFRFLLTSSSHAIPGPHACASFSTSCVQLPLDSSMSLCTLYGVAALSPVHYTPNPLPEPYVLGGP